MMFTKRTIVSILNLTLTTAAFSGCAREREPSPVELDTLSRALFREWEMPLSIARHAADLHTWLTEEGDLDAAWDGLRLSNLTEADVAGVDFPEDTDLSAHGGMATGMLSAFGVEDHAGLLVAADQTFTDPGSFVEYERVIEGDTAAFVDGIGLIRTTNTIRKAGAFGVEIPYVLRKDYRWVDVGDTPMIVGRAWIQEPGCSENGRNCVLQSWGVEAFAATDGGTLRLYEVWIEVQTEVDSLLSLDQKLGLVARGNQDLLEATEDALAAQ